ELDQHLPSLNALPVANTDGPHDAGLERLDDFGAPARDDFSRRRGDDVDLAKRRPGQGQAKQRNDRHTNGPPARRGRRLDDFQRRRQKRELMLVMAIWSRRKRDDVLGGVLSGLHGSVTPVEPMRRSARPKRGGGPFHASAQCVAILLPYRFSACLEVAGMSGWSWKRWKSHWRRSKSLLEPVLIHDGGELARELSQPLRPAGGGARRSGRQS